MPQIEVLIGMVLINLSKNSAVARTSNIVEGKMNPDERNIPSQEASFTLRRWFVEGTLRWLAERHATFNVVALLSELS